MFEADDDLDGAQTPAAQATGLYTLLTGYARAGHEHSGFRASYARGGIGSVAIYSFQEVYKCPSSISRAYSFWSVSWSFVLEFPFLESGCWAKA